MQSREAAVAQHLRGCSGWQEEMHMAETVPC